MPNPLSPISPQIPVLVDDPRRQPPSCLPPTHQHRRTEDGQLSKVCWRCDDAAYDDGWEAVHQGECTRASDREAGDQGRGGETVCQ